MSKVSQINLIDIEKICNDVGDTEGISGEIVLKMFREQYKFAAIQMECANPEIKIIGLGRFIINEDQRVKINKKLGRNLDYPIHIPFVIEKEKPKKENVKQTQIFTLPEDRGFSVKF